MALRLSLVVEGNAAGAAKAASETVAAVDRVVDKVATVPREAEAAAKGIAEIGLSARGSATLGVQALGDIGSAASQAAAQANAAGTAVAAAAGRTGQAAGGAVKLTTQQLAGMQFQLQDLAVQLASGSSPFVAITQQGSQIVQMFGSGTGVMAALRGVGAGLATFLVNPLNIALLGFAALAGGASLAWGAITGGAEETETALERHEALIGRIRDAWPEAAEGAADYARESAAVVQSQLRDAADALKASLKESVQAALDELGSTRRSGFFDVAAEFEPFEAAIRSFRDSLRAGDADVKAFRRSVATIADAEPENAALQALKRSLFELTDASLEDAAALSENAAAIRGLGASAAGEIARVEAFGDALRALQGISLPNLSDREQAVAGLKSAFDNAEGPLVRAAALKEYEAALGRVGAEEKRIADEKSAREAASSAKRSAGVAESGREREAKAAEAERRSVQDLIGSLSEEYALLGVSASERQVQIALRQAGAAATAAERGEIRAIIEATNDRREAEAEAIAGLDRARGVVNSMVSAFRQSQTAGEGFFAGLGAAAETLAQKLQDRIFENFLARLMGEQGSSDGGWLGDLIGRGLGALGGSGGGGGSGAAAPALASAGALAGPAMRGFASAPPARSAVSGFAAPTVNAPFSIINNGPPVAATVAQEPDGFGGVRTDITLQSMTTEAAKSPRVRRSLGLPSLMKPR